MNVLDRLAAYVGIWALRRLYGADCETNIRDDFPDDPEARCLSCDAKVLMENMREFLKK